MAQKSIRAELNGSTVTSSWRCRAYGETAQNSGAAAPSILGYAGQLLDRSGLYYMRARWYDAGNTRFLSRDALANGLRVETPVSLQAFAYGDANPIAMLDPTGWLATTDSLDSCKNGHSCGTGAVDRLGDMFADVGAAASRTGAFLASALTPPHAPGFYLDLVAGEDPDKRRTADSDWQLVLSVATLNVGGGTRKRLRDHQFGRRKHDLTR